MRLSLRRWRAALCACLCLVFALVPALALADGDQSGASPIYQTLAELEGKRFAYVNGSVYNQKMAEKLSDTQEEFYASLADFVAAVEAGKDDAAVQLSYCCELVVNRKGGTVALLPESVADVEEAFFFPHGSRFTAEFNDVINKFYSDGTIDKLTQKWVSASNEDKTLPAQDWDAPNGTLKFATSGVLEPFSYVGEGGEALGYDVELALLIAKELGYQTVFWSLAYKDWDNNKQPTAEYALGKLIPRTHNGAVILLHSTSQTNAEVLDELLTQWKNLGYRFETVDKLFP